MKSPRSPRRLRRFGRGILKWLVLPMLAFYAVATLELFFLRSHAPLFTTVQVQRRIEAFWHHDARPRQARALPLAQISPHLQHAVVAAEDGRFFSHGGIDWVEVERAVDASTARRRLRGASTITQQLVKNLFFTTHRSAIRKVLEMPLVLAAEALLSKRRILELYLNVIEWGPNVYGAEAAAAYHYGVSAAQLSREQAARLAACLPAPRTRTPQRMDRYAAIILDRMHRNGW